MPRRFEDGDPEMPNRLANKIALWELEVNRCVDKMITTCIWEEVEEAKFSLTPEFHDRLEKALKYSDNAEKALAMAFASMDDSFDEEEISLMVQLTKNHVRKVDA